MISYYILWEQSQYVLVRCDNISIFGKNKSSLGQNDCEG